MEKKNTHDAPTDALSVDRFREALAKRELKDQEEAGMEEEERRQLEEYETDAQKLVKEIETKRAQKLCERIKFHKYGRMQAHGLAFVLKEVPRCEDEARPSDPQRLAQKSSDAIARIQRTSLMHEQQQAHIPPGRGEENADDNDDTRSPDEDQPRHCDYEILQVSANVEEILGLRPEEVLGKPLEHVVGQANYESFCAGAARVASKPMMGSSIRFEMKGKPYECVMSMLPHGEPDPGRPQRPSASGDPAEDTIESDALPSPISSPSRSMPIRTLLLEAEPLVSAPTSSSTSSAYSLGPRVNNRDELYSAVARATENLHAIDDSQKVLEFATQHFARLTGYDRVMVYKFHPDHHGEVVAETKAPFVQTSYLGLHFPKSDIPDSVRATFLSNQLRIIAEVRKDYPRLVPPRDPLHSEATDLRNSILRAPHPIHVEYLSNMGVTASLVLAIRIAGKMWGMLVCHHYSGAVIVSHAMRLYCQVFVSVFSMRLHEILLQEESATESDNKQRTIEISNLLYRIRSDMALPTLAGKIPEMLKMLGASTAVLHTKERVYEVGDKLPPRLIDVITRYRLGSVAIDGIQVTDSLLEFLNTEFAYVSSPDSSQLTCYDSENDSSDASTASSTTPAGDKNRRVSPSANMVSGRSQSTAPAATEDDDEHSSSSSSSDRSHNSRNRGAISGGQSAPHHPNRYAVGPAAGGGFPRRTRSAGTHGNTGAVASSVATTFVQSTIDYSSSPNGSDGSEFTLTQQDLGEFCGMLQIVLSDEPYETLTFFRKEFLSEVKWAGKVNEPKLKHGRLMPRASFALWRQTHAGKSKPWTSNEISCAKILQQGLSGHIASWHKNDLQKMLRVEEREKAKLERDKGIAELKTQMKSAFLANVSHEIRTPLHSVIAAVDLLLDDVSARDSVPSSKKKKDLTKRKNYSTNANKNAEHRTKKQKSDDRNDDRLKQSVDKLPSEASEGRAKGRRNSRGKQKKTGRRQSSMTKEQRDLLMTIQDGAVSLSCVVNDVLSMSQIEAGKFKAHLRPCSAIDIVEKVCELYKHIVTDRNLRLTFETSEEFPQRIVTDGDKFRQVAINLISNAIKFTKEGGVTVDLAVASDPRSLRRINRSRQKSLLVLSDEQLRSCLHLSVRDTGIGIPREKFRDLFKAFEQVDSSYTREYGGMGLGLSICKALVDKLEGAIWCESRVGRGTTFHVVVPYLPVEPDDVGQSLANDDEREREPIAATPSDVRANEEAALAGNKEIEDDDSKATDHDRADNKRSAGKTSAEHGDSSTKEEKPKNSGHKKDTTLRQRMRDIGLVVHAAPPPATTRSADDVVLLSSSSLSPSRKKKRTHRGHSPSADFARTSRLEKTSGDLEDRPTKKDREIGGEESDALLDAGKTSPAELALSATTTTPTSSDEEVAAAAAEEEENALAYHSSDEASSSSYNPTDQSSSSATSLSTRLSVSTGAVTTTKSAAAAVSDRRRRMSAIGTHTPKRIKVYEVTPETAENEDEDEDDEDEDDDDESSSASGPSNAATATAIANDSEGREEDEAKRKRAGDDKDDHHAAPSQHQTSTTITKPTTRLDDKPSLSSSASSTATTSDGRSKKSFYILLAEDNPINQKIMRMVLARAGHVVDVASNGREAVDKAMANPYDAILMDVQMPTMNGLEATTCIRAWEESEKQKLKEEAKGRKRRERKRSRDNATALRLLCQQQQQKSDSDNNDSTNVTIKAKRRRKRNHSPAGEDKDENGGERRRRRQDAASDEQETESERREREAIEAEEQAEMAAAQPLDERQYLRAMNKRVPIIALTAHALEEHGEQCIAAGMDACLAKPLNKKQLFDTLDRLASSPTGKWPASLTSARRKSVV